MDKKLAVGGAVALPAALTIIGGYALGYVHGHQDALGSVWNLRGHAQCLDPSASTDADSGEQEPSRSQWVWKSGPLAGEPVQHHIHGFSNPFKGVPLLDALGERLASALSVDIANWRPPSY